MTEKIKIIAAGGTIDKIYFDAKSQFQVGEPQIHQILEEAHVNFDYEIESLLQKDSLELTDHDRQLILDCIEASPQNRFIVTHGTDTMTLTAQYLGTLPGKVVVFTGSMQPAKFRASDALFNVGCAITAVQLLPPGIYIAMNGQVLPADNAVKNLEHMRFEPKSGSAIVSPLA